MIYIELDTINVVESNNIFLDLHLIVEFDIVLLL